MKSGSPCAAYGSKTRSSFLHLQIECRGIRDSRHCRDRCFSIINFCPFYLFPAVVFALALVQSEILRKKTVEIVLHGAEDISRTLKR